MSSNSGRVEDSVQYRSLGPGVSEAGSGVRGYSQYDHPGLLGHGPWCGGGPARGGGLHQPGCLLLGGGSQLGALHLAHLAQLQQVCSAEAESAAVTCSVMRDSLRVCTSLTGSGPLDARGLLGVVLGEHEEVAAHGQEAGLLACGGHLLLLLLGHYHARLESRGQIDRTVLL